MRRKTTIGLVALIAVSGEAPCGGVVGKIKKLHPVVNFRSTFVKKTNRRAIRKKIQESFLKCVVSFAKRSVTKPMIAIKIPT